MTISTTNNRFSQAGNGVTTAFTYGARFLANADLKVIVVTDATGVEDPQVLDTDYAVTGAGAANGGTVTFLLAAPATGTTVTIYGDPVITQGVNPTQNDSLDVNASLEDPMDRLTLIAQRNRDLIARSLRLPDGDSGFDADDMVLPAKVVRASTILGFNADAKPIPAAGGLDPLLPVTPYAATVLDDLTAAEAAATLLVPSLADLANTATAGLGTALLGWLNSATGAVATTLKQWLGWQSYHVMEFMSTAQRADVLAGTAAVDVTSAIRVACDALQTRGGGRLEFGNYRYAVYGTPSTTPLGAFSSLRGIELSASGAEFVITGNFESFADIATLFKFTACNNVRLGDFKGAYTGTARSEIFTRGGQLAQFEQGCTNVDIGNLNISDWALAVRFQKLFSDPTSYRSRNVRIANINGTNVGYNLTCDNSGDNLDAQINSTGCGRSYIAYNPKANRVLVKSKNQVASSDCLAYAFQGGILEDLDLTYINTESTNSGAGTRIGVTLAFRDGDVAAATMRNVNVRLNITQEGGGFLTGGLLVEKLKADASLDTVDRGHSLINLHVSGVADTNSGGLQLGDYTTWGTGEFVRNPVIENMFLDGGQPSLYLFSSLQDNALIRNVVYDSALNIVGNTTGKITCIGVKATEVTLATTDTSLMDFVGCSITTAANLSFVGKNFTDTLIAGELYNGPKKLLRNSKSADYTLTLGDANRLIWHPGSDAVNRTFTIPANSSVAFPIGTEIRIVNSSANAVTIAITSDTLVFAGVGTTGTRTLGVDSVAQLIKVDSAVWYISGDARLT